jgi:serine/threonine protein kinase
VLPLQFPAVSSDMNLSDFTLGEKLGEGSFGHVVQAVRRSDGKECALKVLEIRLLVRHKKQNQVMQEKQLLIDLDHPGIVKLYGTFKDDSSLYMSIELVAGPELFDLIKRCGRLPEGPVSFYIGEVRGEEGRRIGEEG